MEALFLKLVNLSITAGWLVLAALVVRLVFRRAPRWIFCLLWGLVALRLVCPVSIESALSLIPSAQTLPPEIVYTAAPRIDSGIGAIDRAVLKNNKVKANLEEIFIELTHAEPEIHEDLDENPDAEPDWEEVEPDEETSGEEPDEEKREGDEP